MKRKFIILSVIAMTGIAMAGCQGASGPVADNAAKETSAGQTSQVETSPDGGTATTSGNLSLEPGATSEVKPPVIPAEKIKSDYSLSEDYYKTKQISFVDAAGKATAMEKAAARQITDKKQDITAFAVPANPTDADIVYFSATTAYIQGPKYTNTIYSYNLKTGALKELVKQEFTVGVDNALWRTVGREGTKILVMSDLIDNSPGPCSSIWIDGYKFNYLGMVKPADGLKVYAVPQYKADEAQKEQQKCVKDMDTGATGTAGAAGN